MGELLTIVGLVGVLYGEAKALPTVRAVTKPIASLGFIVAALGFGALDSQYGKTIFVGLLLGALGDVLLLGQSKRAFIGGLVAFLLGHVAYVVAFASLPQNMNYALAAGAVTLAAFVVIARWVFPHAPDMRVPIGVYMLVIGLMVALGFGAFRAGAPWMIPVGATLFAFSDIGVVRNRFVSPGFVNRAWGLPMYYAAQLLIAWSIAAI